MSQRKRNRGEEIVGGLKTVGRLRSVKFRGGPRVGGLVTCAAAAYNLVQRRNLVAAAT